MAPGATGTGDRLEHFVSTEPFDPYAAETLTPEQERYYMASQWTLMWFKLRKHRPAVIAGSSCSFAFTTSTCSRNSGRSPKGARRVPCGVSRLTSPCTSRPTKPRT